MDDFHFLRPLWLLALPLGPLLAWSLWRRLHEGVQWREVCDPHLLPHLLVAPSAAGRKWPYWILVVATTLALLALAGPAWERLEQPVYRTLNARAVVLDLSRSMDATDYQPSRLTRARFKVVDILRRSRDRPVGLAVFAADGFIITPLTQDANTLISLLPAVDTDIMPAQGSRADLGLQAAARMLERGGARRGEVILITDGVKGRRTAAQAAKLRTAGFRVSVLAAGTPEGAPIPVQGGGFFKQLAGGIVVAMTDYDALRAIARAGGGRFASLSNDDSDIDYLLSNEVPQPLLLDMQAVERTSEVWRDRGPWLLLLLLPLAALAFRRGWLALIPLTIAVMPGPARAITWDDLWTRPDQQAARALQLGDPARAASVARDPLWKGGALYRDGQYQEAADAFAESDETTADYNRGNALARAGRLREALSAYDTVLEADPRHPDALYNRALVARLIEQLRQQSRQQQQQGGASSEGQSGETNQENGSAADQDAGDATDQSQDAGNRRDDAGRDETQAAARGQALQPLDDPPLTAEEQQAMAQWLRRIPDDPGGLLRRKFQLEYSKRRAERPQGTDAW
ncbi:MAG: VWA domain-containing protein [Gammaproteobacteria bacterium]|nr:MAG: VWA domain-containing protein [Gammaproteobacteria bacterium]